MSRIPLFGGHQIDARLDGSPPRLRTRSRMGWRACDGMLTPLNEGISVDYLGRSAAATIYASDGTSGSLVASAPAFSSIDWDGDGVREEDALELSDEEALRFYDADSGALRWALDAQVWRLDWIERGNALVADAPYVTLTNDDATGSYLGVFGDGAGNVVFRHDNGTDTVESSLLVADGNRASARLLFFATGAVQIGLVRNGSSEVLGTKSAACAPVAFDAGVQLRFNEFGTSVRGAMALRTFAAFSGTATRKQLLEVL